MATCIAARLDSTSHERALMSVLKRGSEESMRKVQRSLLALALLAPFVLAAPPAAAQSWPQRTGKFLLPLGPGSGVDIGARLLADRLAARWGQPVVVENRPGGDAVVAISAFVNANDDHVLLMTPTSSFTAHPYLHDNLPYKPADLLPIARVSNTLITIGVPAPLEVSSLEQLISLARATRQAQLGGCHRRARFLVHRILAAPRPEYDQGALPQPGRGRQRSRRGARADVHGGAGNRAAAAAGGKGQAARGRQRRAGSRRPPRTDREGGRLRRTDLRWPGRLVRADRHAQGAARADRGGYSRGRCRRSGDRRAAYRDRANPQHRRAGGIRSGNPGATRQGRRDCQGPRRQADAVTLRRA